MELMVDHAYVVKPSQKSQKHEIQRASRLARLHPHQEGDTPQLLGGTEAPALKTLPNLALCMYRFIWLSIGILYHIL